MIYKVRRFSRSEPNFKPGLLGTFKQNYKLFLAIIAIIAIGPGISRLLKSYRAVVLDVRQDKMLIGLRNLPPQWINKIDVQPSQIIEKKIGQWSPQPVDVEPLDHSLKALSKRYELTYEGELVEILPASAHRGVRSGVIKLSDGKRILAPLMSNHLREAKANMRVKKVRGEWDPRIVDSNPSKPSIPSPTP